jgi:putative MATE family efflux protein
MGDQLKTRKCERVEMEKEKKTEKEKWTGDLTRGSVMGSMLRFAIPMILGNLLQQCYNVADTLIVGKFLGPDPLAAVGSAFTLMTFLTSILLGLCMGSGAVFSFRFGEKDENALKEGMSASFLLIAILTVILNAAAFLCLDGIRIFLQVPGEIWGYMREYLAVIFCGIAGTFLYNYFAALLRAVGNSVAPLAFLAVSAVLNIALDLWFVVGLQRGVAGAAEATVISQYVSGIGLALYTWLRCPWLRIRRRHLRIRRSRIREIGSFSVLTCVQQSVMNLGILMVQGLVNSFGPAVMTAFAAGVKIDAFAYMPVQDFGNAFSTFIAQNYGAKKEERIRAGLKGAVLTALVFCLVISAAVWFLAKPLMLLFVDGSEGVILAEGIRYLHIEGVFYCGIGCLFLLYGLYRALGKPGMSVVLTVISLGTRVVLAYLLSAVPALGVAGIWWSVPIGWGLADVVGLLFYLFRRKKLLSWEKKTLL